MKRNIVIFAILLGAVISQGQNAIDKSAVLQKIIDLPELQQYYPKNADGSLKQLYITQHLVAFPADLSVSKSGSQVLFLTHEEITAKKAEAYFTFRSFGMDQNAANSSLNFFYDYDYGAGQFKMLTINLELHKTGEAWNVSSLNIGGDK